MKPIANPFSSEEEAEALIERVRAAHLSEEDQQQLRRMLDFYFHVRDSVGKATSMKHLYKMLARPFTRKRADIGTSQN